MFLEFQKPNRLKSLNIAESRASKLLANFPEHSGAESKQSTFEELRNRILGQPSSFTKLTSASASTGSTSSKTGATSTAAEPARPRPANSPVRNVAEQPAASAEEESPHRMSLGERLRMEFGLDTSGDDLPAGTQELPASKGNLFSVF